MNDLYRQQILHHNQHPQNWGSLDDADKEITEANLSCGDRYTFYLKLLNLPLTKGEGLDSIQSEGVIIDNITFVGEGCAISKAASSMLTTELIDQPLTRINELDLQYMQELIGTEVTLLRQKCLLLPLHALQKMLE